MITYSMSETDVTNALNIGKERLLYALYKENQITVEQFNYCVRNYALVVGKRSWLGSVIDALFGGKDDTLAVTVVKIAAPPSPETEEKSK